MLDYKNFKSFPLDNKNEACLKEKTKQAIKSEMTKKAARTASFFSLASVLGACNFGGGSDSIAPLDITAIKAPLDGALGFVDRNNDGVWSTGEEKAITNSTGSASISLNSAVTASDKVVISSIKAGDVIDGVTYSTGTVDTGTGETIEDLVLKAPATFAVVTPVTTVVAETGLSEEKVKEVLGLPANLDVKTFNPFKENKTAAEEELALAAEKVALKVHTTISTIQASAKGAGLDVSEAFATAIEAVADVVKTQSNAGLKADLADSAIIDKVVTATSTKMTAKLIAKGVDATTAAANVKAADAVLATAKAQIATINTATDAIKSFDKNELGAIAKLADKSKKEAAEAVTAEKATPGAGKAKFTMKTADAVSKAKETAKKEVEASTGEKAKETVAESGGTSTVTETPFVLTEGSKVDWAIGVSAGAKSAEIKAADAPDATYTVSSGVMTVNLGQAFSLETVQDLMTKKADLTFALSLKSLPTKDDLTANKTTVTITEGVDSKIDANEGQIKASANSTYTATSSTQTDFYFSPGTPMSISYTPRSGNSDVAVSIKNESADIYRVTNDGNWNDDGGQAVLELKTNTFFDRLDDNSSNWAQDKIMAKFVTANTEAVHLAVDVADLGLYNGSTKITTVQTTLNIKDNPTVGGVVYAEDGTTAAVYRTDLKLTASTIADIDGIKGGAGGVTKQWEVSSDGTNWTNAAGTGNNTYTYTIGAKGSADEGKFIRFKYTYEDLQGNKYTNKVSATPSDKVVANSGPTGDVTITSAGTGVGDVLTVTNNLTDADKKADVANLDANGKPATVNYQWYNGTHADGSTGYAKIAGATSSTYTLQTTDVGKYVTVIASYTDDYLGPETKAASKVDGAAGVRTETKVAPTYIYAKTESKSADALKLGFYLDYSELKAAADADTSTPKIDWTKVASYQFTFSIADKTDYSKSVNWSDHFDGIDASSKAAQADYDKTGTDALFIFDRTGSFLANATSGTIKGNYEGKETISIAGLSLASDYVTASKDEFLSFLTFNPKGSTLSGDTLTMSVTGTAFYGWDGTTSQKFDLSTNPYTFDIVL